MKKQPSLQFCLAMDAIGCIPFLALPLLGEAFDMIWAPVSAVIFYFAFGKRKALFGAAFSMIEEMIPFLNFVPTFTIAWLWQKYIVRDANKVVVIKPS